MNNIEQAINERIGQLDGELRKLNDERLRLEQALALIGGEVSPLARAAAATATAIPEKKEESKASSRRKKWRAGKPHPWVPAKHAKPFTLAIYDILANGKAFSTEEIVTLVGEAGFPVSKQQVWGCLGHMKDTGRITYAGGKWRRKYARNPENLPPAVEIGPGGLSATVLEGASRTETVERLEELVKEGVLVKSGGIGGLVRYAPAGNSRDDK